MVRRGAGSSGTYPVASGLFTRLGSSFKNCLSLSRSPYAAAFQMSSTGGASSVAIAPSRRRAYRGGAMRVPIGRSVVAGSIACAVEVARGVSALAIGAGTRRGRYETRSRALGVARSETRGVDGHLTFSRGSRARSTPSCFALTSTRRRPQNFDAPRAIVIGTDYRVS